MVNSETLIKFEEDIANCFNNKQIRAPIHLYHGNEEHIIRVFGHINKNDWICCTWRNHYQCLLAGVPPEELKSRILSGKSMTMCVKSHNIVCSSIVGGIPPIAVGIALANKKSNKSSKVWCWVGDMSSGTGAFNEAYRYSIAHDLPITWIIEDNEKSVETPTKEVWGHEIPTSKYSSNYVEDFYHKIIYYKYTNTKYAHAGANVRVQF